MKKLWETLSWQTLSSQRQAKTRKSQSKKSQGSKQQHTAATTGAKHHAKPGGCLGAAGEDISHM
eukprot:10524017-Prorocentrum_lima.AAC.1